MTSAKAQSVVPNLINGQPVTGTASLDVHDPFTGEVVAPVAMIGPSDLQQALEIAEQGGPPLTRHQRSEVLRRAGQLLAERAETFANLICRESGLCIRDTTYEVGRAQDVLHFAAIEALQDDGRVFSCDVTAQGKERKIFTTRESVRMVAAITPFNHPLNQVVHKLAPAIAVGAPMVLKPSEKTPLTALRFAELLYEAGLPSWMLSVIVGPIETVVEPMIRDQRTEVISFTGSVGVGKRIASIAGYKKLCLELGGNSPLIVLEDANLDLAVQLAAEGCFRNSGQRCTSVKRVLVQQSVLASFTDRFVERSRDYHCGNPSDPEIRVGTVIDEPAAQLLEQRVQDAVSAGGRVLLGGRRRGALMEPTVIADVPRDAEMVVHESFGPLAPILPVRDLDDAISLANATAYGLSCGVVTESLDTALRAVKEIHTGTVNVNEVPGYRLESSPFGGIKDSGLGIKEGVIEAAHFLTNVKTFSLPW